jgi:superfamily I DNA and RNA helicase
MKVEEQIQWDERLWCVNAWGSQGDIHSGAYRYIVHKYQLPFSRYSWSMSFERACKNALDQLTQEDIEKYGYAFDYMLIDESQDFGKAFIDLCTLVTKNTVFVAGDIFQSIFDTNVVSSISPDFLLSKCYRTDPRTLMFSHGVGMALFEKQKLRWLEEPEWKACGYIVDHIAKGRLKLSREPLRRFEDIENENMESIEIVNIQDPFFQQCEQEILKTIQEIRNHNPTVLAEDIGIIFVDDEANPYDMADMLEQSIAANYGWTVNKAYETKDKLPNSIFVSNKNNVKGLEFPFVICIAKRLRLSHSFRNALYMMLTRSFIKTYFLLSEIDNVDEIQNLDNNLEYINNHGAMVVDIPSHQEKEAIKTTIKYDKNAQSFYDFFDECCADMNIPPLFRKELFGATKSILKESFDKDEVVETIEFIAKKKGLWNENSRN